MTQIVDELGPGEPRQAERELGYELDSGITCVDTFDQRGRHRVDLQLPQLMADIKAVVDSQSQTDPSFKTNRLYTRLSAAAVQRQLIAQYGYTADALPSDETIRTRLNPLG